MLSLSLDFVFSCQTKLRAETNNVPDKNVFPSLSLTVSMDCETFPHTLKYSRGPSHFISSQTLSCVLLFLLPNQHHGGLR